MNKDTLDIKHSDHCDKKENCDVCTGDTSISSNLDNLNMNIDLNPNAKTFVPKSQRTEENIKLNLNAKEWTPSNAEVEDEKDEEEEDEDVDNEEFDMIAKDIINDEVMEEINEDDESDADKWFPMYKDCECCKGFVYKCQGKTCIDLGECYCKMKDDCDIEDEN